MYFKALSRFVFVVALLMVTSYLSGVSGQSSSDSLQEILQALEQMVDCTSCLAVLVPMQNVAFTGDEPFVNILVEVCDLLQLDDQDVCLGAMSTQGPIIAHDLRSISLSNQTAERLCDALFGFCSSNVPNEFSVPLPSPTVPRPSSVPSIAPTPRKKPFQVVHISDVHIDRMYTVGSEGNCTKPICCRNFADEAGMNVIDPALPNGNIKCDSPVSLADSMLEAVNNINPSFVIFTGDVVERAIWLVDQSEATNDLEDFNAEMLSKITARVFPSLGNHDTAPVNAFARASSMTVNNSQWVFDIQSAGWEHWIGANASQQVDHASGTYAALVPGTNLIILSVNTQYWYKQNFWLYDSDEFQPDPNGILAFIVEQLQAAEDAGQKVWVIGHIPLGKEDTFEDQSNYYDQILQRYKSTIVGHFFGHSHKDQFEIAYSDYDNQIAENAVSVAMIAPALTPTSGNPAFKLYDVDPDTFGIMNARVIFANVSDPSFQVRPHWTLYYDVRETYGPLVNLSCDEELSPAFWHNLTEVFVANDTAFQLYNTFLTRGLAVSACNASCKDNTICDQRAFRSQNNCDTPTGGVSIGRRGLSLDREVDRLPSECEGPRIGAFFVDLSARLHSATSRRPY